MKSYSHGENEVVVGVLLTLGVVALGWAALASRQGPAPGGPSPSPTPSPPAPRQTPGLPNVPLPGVFPTPSPASPVLPAGFDPSASQEQIRSQLDDICQNGTNVVLLDSAAATADLFGFPEQAACLRAKAAQVRAGALPPPTLQVVRPGDTVQVPADAVTFLEPKNLNPLGFSLSGPLTLTVEVTQVSPSQLTGQVMLVHDLQGKEEDADQAFPPYFVTFASDRMLL